MTGLSIAVIGATSGVGRATIRRLAETGHRVLVIGRNSDKAARLTHDLGRGRGAASAVDISSRAGWDEAAAWITAQTD